MEMDPTTTQGAFALRDGEDTVVGTPVVSAALLTFTPSASLKYATQYTVFLDTTATNTNGVPLAEPFNSWFQTIAGPNPVVDAVTPANGTTLVEPFAFVALNFSEVMDPATDAGITFTTGETSVPGTKTWAEDFRSMVFTPSANLAFATTYVVAVSTEVESALGVPMLAASWTDFTVRPAGPPPVVTTVFPANMTSGIDFDTPVVLTFSEVMYTPSDPAIVISVAGNPVAGTVEWSADDTVATWTPTASFSTSVFVTVTVGTAMESADRVAMAEPFVSFYTTKMVPPTVVTIFPVDQQGNVNLGVQIVYTFSQAMNRAATESAFLITSDGIADPKGNFDWPSSTVLTWAPNPFLLPGVFYNLSMLASATNLEGTPMGADFNTSFRTASIPLVSNNVPADGAKQVPVSTTIVVTFTEPMMLPRTTLAFSLLQGSTPVEYAAAWTLADTVLTVTPTATLTAFTTYTYSVNASAISSRNVPIGQPITASFRTIGIPTIVSSTPANNTDQVSRAITVDVTFSHAMDTASVESAFVLTAVSSGLPVTGAFAWNTDNTAFVFTPAAPLDWATNYQILIAGSATDADGTPLATPLSSYFMTRVMPVVVSVVPANATRNEDVGTNVTVVFSFAMNEAATQSAFSLTGNGAAVAGVFEWSSPTTLLFAPSAPLLPSVTYVVLITTSAVDVNGSPLPEDFRSVFTTRGAPFVDSIVPLNGASEVEPSTTVVVTFSQNMNPDTTAAAFSLVNTTDTITVAGSIAWNGDNTVLTFTPSDLLVVLAKYQVIITTSATDDRGVPMAADFTSNFTVVAIPVVLSVVPTNGAGEVPLRSTIVIQFSLAMNQTSVEGAVSVTPSGGSPIAFTPSWPAADTITLTPTELLALTTVYTVDVTTDAMDTEGHPMRQPFTSQFATVSAPRVLEVIPADGESRAPITTLVMVNFSQPMDQTTTAAAFSVNNTAGGEITWSSDGTILIYTPTGELPASTKFDIAVSVNATDLDGTPLSSAFASAFSTMDIPEVSSVSPADAATEIHVTTAVNITFTYLMNQTSVELAFSLLNGEEPTAGTFAWSSDSTFVTFTPAQNLANAATYAVAVSQDATDMYGTPLRAPFSSSFVTRAAPTVVASVPANGTDLVPQTATVTITFSQPMTQATTEAAFTISNLGTNLPGAYSWNGDNTEVTLTPTDALPEGAVIDIAVADTATDADGSPLQTAFSALFITWVMPTVQSVVPPNDATDIAIQTAVEVTFSRPMSQESVVAALSLLEGGTEEGAPVPGAVTFNEDSTVATFTPTNPLASLTQYLVAVTDIATDFRGTPLAANVSSLFTTIEIPTITGSFPTADEHVHPRTHIRVNFSMPMDHTTTEAAFSLKQQDVTDIVGSFEWAPDDTRFQFIPTNPLEPENSFTYAVTTDAQNQVGTPIAAGISVQFATIPIPTVNSVVPANEATGVPVLTTVVITFSRAMEQSSLLAAFGLTSNDGVRVNGTQTWDDTSVTMTFTPEKPLENAELYNGVVSTAARDSNNIEMMYPFDWSFTTRPQAVVTTVSPVDGALAVDVFTSVVVTFSQPMDANSTQDAFSLTMNGTAAAGAFAWSPDATTMTFQPTLALIGSAPYVVAVTTAAEDDNFTPIETAFSSSFTTQTIPLVEELRPANDTVFVATNVKIEVEFSTPMDITATENAITVYPLGEAPIAGTFSWFGQVKRQVQFTPAETLLGNVTYVVNITRARTVELGYLSAPFIAFFTTRPRTAVGGQFPPAEDSNVTLATNITVNFETPMNIQSVEANFQVVGATSGAVAGHFLWINGNRTLIFVPSAPLAMNDVFTVSISTNALDETGQPLAFPYTATFKTTIFDPLTPCPTRDANGCSDCQAFSKSCSWDVNSRQCLVSLNQVPCPEPYADCFASHKVDQIVPALCVGIGGFALAGTVLIFCVMGKHNRLQHAAVACTVVSFGLSAAAMATQHWGYLSLSGGYQMMVLGLVEGTFIDASQFCSTRSLSSSQLPARAQSAGIIAIVVSCVGIFFSGVALAMYCVMSRDTSPLHDNTKKQNTYRGMRILWVVSSLCAPAAVIVWAILEEGVTSLGYSFTMAVGAGGIALFGALGAFVGLRERIDPAQYSLLADYVGATDYDMGAKYGADRYSGNVNF